MMPRGRVDLRRLEVTGRYARQVLFGGLGKEGQRRLGEGFAVVVGCGGLGSITATLLARAGAGRLRVIDRDRVDYSNLHRQLLYDEEDARNRAFKAEAAERRLRSFNSTVVVEGVVEDVGAANVEGLLRGADVVVDGLDNFETRFLLNDASLKLGIPWIYAGVGASGGMTMNVLPGRPPCLRCLLRSIPDPQAVEMMEAAGLIGPAPVLVGSLQSVEAMKVMTGAAVRGGRLTCMDAWSGRFDVVDVAPDPDCRSCRGHYDFLKDKAGR
jgi:molybdopterin/thiamine biosynthesis adenylyltransferase